MEQIVKEQQSNAGGKAAGEKPDAAACQAEAERSGAKNGGGGA